MLPLNMENDYKHWRLLDDLSVYFYRKLCQDILKQGYLDSPKYLHIYIGPDSLLEQYA